MGASVLRSGPRGGWSPGDSPILTLFDQPARCAHFLPVVCQVPRHRAASGMVPATQESKPPVREPDLETNEIPLLNQAAEQRASLTGLVWR